MRQDFDGRRCVKTMTAALSLLTATRNQWLTHRELAALYGCHVRSIRRRIDTLRAMGLDVRGRQRKPARVGARGPGQRPIEYRSSLLYLATEPDRQKRLGLD